jgi:hypothetical protein
MPEWRAKAPSGPPWELAASPAPNRSGQREGALELGVPRAQCGGTQRLKSRERPLQRADGRASVLAEH